VSLELTIIIIHLKWQILNKNIALVLYNLVLFLELFFITEFTNSLLLINFTQLSIFYIHDANIANFKAVPTIRYIYFVTRNLSKNMPVVSSLVIIVI